jgi:uncharacterized ferritin-like protein (DUF455 family)
MTFLSLTEGAVAVLTAADPADKRRLSARLAADWQAGGLDIGRVRPPDRPARPARPELLPPSKMPRRRAGQNPANRVALLHALAHIELNAIDLAWDLIARFAGRDLPRAFLDDWVAVAAEEAVHFGLVCGRLEALDAAYGDLPAHDGLWEAAANTTHDLAARLAVVPLVLEARGLDVTPAMIERFERFGDTDTAAMLRRILADEIKHVAAGRRWFDHLCAAQGIDAPRQFRALVKRHYGGLLKPPFNETARTAAGFGACYYDPKAKGDEN